MLKHGRTPLRPFHRGPGRRLRSTRNVHRVFQLDSVTALQSDASLSQLRRTGRETGSTSPSSHFDISETNFFHPLRSNNSSAISSPLVAPGAPFSALSATRRPATDAYPSRGMVCSWTPSSQAQHVCICRYGTWLHCIDFAVTIRGRPSESSVSRAAPYCMIPTPQAIRAQVSGKVIPGSALCSTPWLTAYMHRACNTIALQMR
jgi:hypothetical protein